ncbi:ferric reductase-like transmembrane domain-containing protein [Mycolicibacterium palauense]|uniref:ferric reductase-like transmembrane domain-containing protein n=1 Tax=Mycolicibacterium palauense TaxID=2034511 RepID=UPI000BFF19EE|nr:ferric reductase-like transmembrane domain-containing protein [Mycolicibacterium palauense]
MDEAMWALGRGTGMVALAFFTLSIALGVVTRSGRRLGRLPRFAVVDVHRFAALFAVVLVGLHVTALLADPYAQLRLVDVVVPFLGHYRPVWQGLGTLAVDLTIAVVITSLLRHRLGLRAFRVVHWAAYALWPVAFVHALGNGTDAGRPWFLLFAGLCAVTVATALAWRVRADFAEYAATRVAVRS